MNLQLVPLSLNEVDERVANFKRLSAEVCKIVPDILLAAMNMLFEQYKCLKNNSMMVSKFEDSAFLRVSLGINILCSLLSNRRLKIFGPSSRILTSFRLCKIKKLFFAASLNTTVKN